MPGQDDEETSAGWLSLGVCELSPSTVGLGGMYRISNCQYSIYLMAHCLFVIL